MKNDARLLLNRKKQSASNRRQVLTWKNQTFKSRTVDARNILNVKRHQHKSKNPVFGTFMRTNTATDFIASQIKKEISPGLKAPEKQIEVSNDGNIIITAKSKKPSQVMPRRGLLQQMEVDFPSSSRSIQTSVVYRPSTSSVDDLEDTALEDLLDVESLPPAYVSSKTSPVSNISRKPHVDINQILESRNTMIADQLTQPPKISCAKVYVSNLHPSVSQQDLVELFGDVGMMKEAEMLMPGTAIIDFYNAEDAARACETYHNRLLDGLPMKCYLQTQKARPQRSTISQRLGNRIVPQPSPVPKPAASSLITNPRSRFNPRNVQFTVKLA